MLNTAPELVLAINDPDFGPDIRKTRIYPPAERTAALRLERVIEKMNAANALDLRSAVGKKNQDRIDKAKENAGLIPDLEIEWLSQDEQERLGIWHAETSFVVHDEAVQIATFLIKTYRRDLLRYRFAVIMAHKIPPTLRRARLGTAMKLPGKMSWLAGYDGIVTLDHGQWCQLTDRDRQRLVHHELEHFEINEGRLALRAHDFEEFVSIIDRYGLRSESEHFSTDGHVADSLNRAAKTDQLELIEA